MGAPTLRIRLLGELDLRHGETALPPLESARAGSLLAFLLLHRDVPQSRQRLAFLLWPDSTESQARTNLRHLLHTLRRALPDADRFLEVKQRTLQWRPDAPFWLDVAAFEAAISRAESATDHTVLAALREAVELYSGDLLQGSYDEWLLGERERLRQRYLEALIRLTTLLEARGDPAQALRYAEWLRRLDPLHEETYQLLMRLHDARGDRARALRVYHVCAATLQRELGIEPSPATQKVYQTLLTPAPDVAAMESQPGGLGRFPIVGRLPERTRLADLWRAAVTGGPRFVLVTGEPGIGKTRLIEDFFVWCAQRGAVTADARAYPAEGALAYGPVVTWLRAEGIRARRERLDRSSLIELARLLPEIHPDASKLTLPDLLTEREHRQRLFDAAARAILVAGGPLLLVADDIHWWDRESLQFLHYLLRAEPDARLLVAATARREELDHPHPLNDLLAGLHAHGRLTEIELGRLSREETTALAERFGGQPLAEPDAEQLYHETEGNPLFVVEALRAGWRTRHARPGWTSPRVQTVIESRLGQLSEPARDLVGVAATIGREFTSEVLASASGADEETLVRSLDELWRRRIIREQGTDAYDFSHDKIREVAYLALGPARRRHHHLRVARALERLAAHDPGPVSGQIAGHYERAGEVSAAVAWYERAAEAAQQLFANAEAIRLLGQALGIVRALPPGSARDTRELELLAALPGPLVASEGFASNQLADVQRRARELERALQVEPAAPLLRTLAVSSLTTGDFDTARRVGEQLHARSLRDADDVLLVEAEYVLGIAAFWSGEFDAARRHFEIAVERSRPEQRREHLFWYGQDTKVICMSRLANTLWFLGRTEAAIQTRDAALALAEEVGHPYSHSTALAFAALLDIDMRDFEHLRQCVAALRARTSEQEARQTQISREIFAAYVAVLDGQKETGIARIQRALDDSRGVEHAPGQHAMITHLLLAGCDVTGQARAGLAAAGRALEMGGARLWEAEIRRLRAVFLASLGAPAGEVEAELAHALEIARGQGAKMLELRATVSLLRHRLERGDDREVREARGWLAAVVEALPAGCDTQELREAAALLARI